MDIINRIKPPKYLSFLILIVTLQVPSLRIIYKLVPDHYKLVIPLFFIIIGFYYYFLVFHNNRLFIKTLNNSLLPIFLLLIIAVANYYIYPIVDARKDFMLGSDQDDAITAVTEAMFSGISPYSVKTYLNPGASTGPGLAILLSPFILSGTYFLVTPTLIGVLVYLIYNSTKNIYFSNLFLLLLISSPAFWELMTNGSDLIAFGILCIVPLFIWKKSLPKPLKFLIIVFISMVLTSRIIFIYLAPLYAIFFCDKKKVILLKYSLLIIVITICIHLIFYIIEPSKYTPLLLIDKGLKLLNIQIVIFSTFIFIFIYYLSMRLPLNLKNNILLLWVWTAIPLFFVAIISINYHQNILGQYSFTYLAPQLPMFLTYFIINQSLLKTE